MPFGCFKKSDDFDLQLDRPAKECFFVITAIFNPASFQSRYNLYQDFARHMKNTGAQLITIECIFQSLNQTEFHVTESNNPNHIQVKSKDVYWVKEDLINIAVQRLPSHAKWVCWLDADIHFHEKNWIDLTIKQLKKYLVVQMFRKARFLGPSPKFEVLRNDYSFGYSVVHGKPIDQNRYDEWYPHSGYGWAMDVEAFRRIGGLPDYDIVGSGDLHFAFSLLNRVSNAIESNLHPHFREAILMKSQNTFIILRDIAGSKDKRMVGYVPMKIAHFWHGSRKNRQYTDRWKILIAHQFNYATDVRRAGNGLLEFVTNGRTMPHITSSLQEDILAHFQMRMEDETDCVVEENVIRKSVPKTKTTTSSSHSSPTKHFSPSRRRHSSDSDSDQDNTWLHPLNPALYPPNTNYGNNYDRCNDPGPVFCPTDGGLTNCLYPGNDGNYPPLDYCNTYSGTVQSTSCY